MALITLAEYKAYAGITGTDLDTQLAVLLSIAQEQVRSMAGRSITDGFESASRTLVLDGNGQNALQLVEWPVTSITSVSEIDDQGTATAYATTDYSVEAKTGLLHRGRYTASGRFAGDSAGGWQGAGVYDTWGTAPCWPEGETNISVVYTGGYATIPYGIKMACYRAIDMLRADAGKGNFTSETISGDYSYTRGAVDDGMMSVAKFLAPFMTGGA